MKLVLSAKKYRNVAMQSTLRPVYTDDWVTVTVALTGRTFDLVDRHCDGQNGLCIHFVRQGNISVTGD